MPRILASASWVTFSPSVIVLYGHETSFHQKPYGRSPVTPRYWNVDLSNLDAQKGARNVRGSGLASAV
jgi:hypothetical protein